MVGSANKPTEFNGAAGVDFGGTFSHPGHGCYTCAHSQWRKSVSCICYEGREAPVGRSISGRGHFGPRKDTVGSYAVFSKTFTKRPHMTKYL